MAVYFRLGIGFPGANASGYQELFAIEQWMRRIALIALATEVGPQVNGAIPSEMLHDLKKRNTTILASRYLGIAPPGDIFSLTTLEELRLLLTSDSIFPSVRRLTGYPRDLINSKLDEIREIRNAVGHNRILSDKTCRILDAAVLSLEDGIDRLRVRIAGGPGMRRSERLEEPVLVEHFQRALASRPAQAIPNDRLRLSQDNALYYASLIPRHLNAQRTDEVSTLGEWIDLQRLIGIVDKTNPVTLAVVLPIRGTSFELVWPRKASPQQHRLILDAFVDAVDNIWGNENFAQQDQRMFVHPLIWFPEEVEGSGDSVFSWDVAS